MVEAIEQELFTVCLLKSDELLIRLYAIQIRICPTTNPATHMNVRCGAWELGVLVRCHVNKVSVDAQWSACTKEHE